jgi:hypothetical protein
MRDCVPTFSRSSLCDHFDDELTTSASCRNLQSRFIGQSVFIQDGGSKNLRNVAYMYTMSSPRSRIYIHFITRWSIRWIMVFKLITRIWKTRCVILCNRLLIIIIIIIIIIVVTLMNVFIFCVIYIIFTVAATRNTKMNFYIASAHALHTIRDNWVCIGFSILYLTFRRSRLFTAVVVWIVGSKLRHACVHSTLVSV